MDSVCSSMKDMLDIGLGNKHILNLEDIENHFVFSCLFVGFIISLSSILIRWVFLKSLNWSIAEYIILAIVVISAGPSWILSYILPTRFTRKIICKDPLTNTDSFVLFLDTHIYAIAVSLAVILGMLKLNSMNFFYNTHFEQV